jgi:hypothetical protein
MKDKDLKIIQENYKIVKQNIAQEPYYLSMREAVLSWAKRYSDHSDNDKGAYLFEIVRNTMIDQKLSRLQAYALVGLIVELIYDANYMNDEIDSFIDNSLFSRINGDGDSKYTFSFPDDPLDEDPQQYAWSNKWKLWRENK